MAQYNEIFLDTKLSPDELFIAFHQKCGIAFLLQSAEGEEKLARFSFIGFNPDKHLVLKRGVFEANKEKYAKNPFEEIKKNIDANNNQTEGFTGGAVGYFSFEFIDLIEKTRQSCQDETGFPYFEVGIYNDAIIFDHLANRVKYIYSGKNRVNEIYRIISSVCQESPLKIKLKSCNMTKEEFCNKVKEAKKYIISGDIFQAIISKRHGFEFEGSLIHFYRKLKSINPSPYMYYLKFGDREIIGASPENLIRIENRKITSYATLAGTRPRGKTPEEDKLLADQLLNDGKECAEHSMLVDLTRNDIGKVATPGSVKVPELMSIHKFSHVQHIASQVCGELAEGKSAFDAFTAIFPAGTVCGAPKIRAREIIGLLEKEKRGPYGGAVGYFSSNGNADFAIAIRTLFAEKNKAYIQSGAGIVFDSVPEKEFEETEKKAEALLDAVGG